MEERNFFLALRRPTEILAPLKFYALDSVGRIEREGIVGID